MAPQGGTPWQPTDGPRLPAGQHLMTQSGPDKPSAPRSPGGGNRTPRLVGALALLLVAVLTTVTVVSWVWTKADAISPVDLPSAKGAPLKTVNPSVRPSATPPPLGRVVGSNIVASNNDTMPLMSAAWSDISSGTDLYGGTSIWLTVHQNYDGKTATWGNYVAFGGLNKTIPFKNTPAGLKAAATSAATHEVLRLYDAKAVISNVKRRSITVKGHAAHELVFRIAVKVPKLDETFSTMGVTVIDRGDGTADVAVADIAGSTPQWLPIWRARVQQITIGG